MRLKTLSQLRRQGIEEIVLATLPEDILITDYAWEKGFRIDELIKKVHSDPLEWYGFTIAKREDPEVIVDIALPKNDENADHYTKIEAERIAEFQKGIAPEKLINGWIHSHGSLNLEHFSETDDKNNLTVLDFVTSLLIRPVAKREVLVKDLAILVRGHFSEKDLLRGSVSLITDGPISEATLLETVLGGFSYSIVIGEGRWHDQEIHYKRRSILTGTTGVEKKKAKITVIETKNPFSDTDLSALEEEVRTNIRPIKYKVAKLENI